MRAVVPAVLIMLKPMAVSRPEAVGMLLVTVPTEVPLMKNSADVPAALTMIVRRCQPEVTGAVEKFVAVSLLLLRATPCQFPPPT